MLKYAIVDPSANTSYLSNYSTSNLLGSSAALSESASQSNNSSSKAVLAALRALQDKIRRLESERAQANDESAQLKHQLKVLEIENDHAKQKESLASQKALQEAKAAYERLLSDKTELEVKLAKLEERNKSAQRETEDLQSKIRFLEDEKHSATTKLRDLEYSHQQLDLQIKSAQQKEKDFAQNMIWESKRHEEEIGALQKRVQALQAELSEQTTHKAISDAKVLELDQLVGQLLSVNESLVQQLSGKVMMRDTVSSAKKSKVAKKKVDGKPSSLAKPAPTDNATVLSGITGNAKKLSGTTTTSEIEQLKAMHKMYANIARSITKSDKGFKTSMKSASKKRSTSASARKSNSSPPPSARSASGTRSSSVTTRLSRHKEKDVRTMRDSQSTASLMDIRIPKVTNSLDDSSALHIDYDDYLRRENTLRSQPESQLYSSSALAQHNNYHSARNTAYENESISAESASHNGNSNLSNYSNNNINHHQNQFDNNNGHKSGNNDELQQVISSLEEEFDALNNQYRRLLSSSTNGIINNTSTNNNTYNNNDNSNKGAISGRHVNSGEGSGQVTVQQMQSQADEIVSVIQKLHQKGEQLRALKNPLR